MRGGIAEVCGGLVGVSFGGDRGRVVGEHEELWEAGREISGREPNVELVDGGLNGSTGGENGIGVVG